MDKERAGTTTGDRSQPAQQEWLVADMVYQPAVPQFGHLAYIAGSAQHREQQLGDKRLAYIIYQRAGAHAVVEGVNNSTIKATVWRYCHPCEAVQPHTNDNRVYDCLICGGTTPAGYMQCGCGISHAGWQHCDVCNGCWDTTFTVTVHLSRRSR